MSSHSISASVIYKNERRRKAGYYRTYKTNLSNFVENKLYCKRNCYERKKLFEIRRLEVCKKWEYEESASTTSWWVLNAKSYEKITRLTAHFLIAANARTDEFNERFWRFPGRRIKIFGKDFLSFHVNLRWFQVLVCCLAATKDCRLIQGINLEYRRTFLKTIFYVWFTSRSSSQNFIWRRAKKSRSNSLGSPGKSKNNSDKWRRT